MEDRCICCGAIIPEGNWYCPVCLICTKQEDDENENHEISQPCI